MDAEEIENEIAPVGQVHVEVPAAAGREEEEKTGEEMDVLHFLDVFFPYKEEKTGKSWEGDADGAFREDRQACENPGEVVILFIFLIAQVKCGDSAVHEKEERRVGDDRFREEVEFKARSEKNGCAPGSALPIDAAGKPEGTEHIGASEKRRWEARRPFGESEEGKRGGQFPVVENGFVVPVPAVNLGREPVAGEDHFFRSEGVIRFRRICHGKE